MSTFSDDMGQRIKQTIESLHDISTPVSIALVPALRRFIIGFSGHEYPAPEPRANKRRAKEETSGCLFAIQKVWRRGS